VIGLVTLDFWQRLFADTSNSLRQAHVLRLEGVRVTLAEAGHLYRAAELAATDARAGETLAAVWREHRDMSALAARPGRRPPADATLKSPDWLFRLVGPRCDPWLPAKKPSASWSRR